MINKNKRGSHVGVVISFILFITFIIFIYVLLDYRVNQQQNKTNTLENVKEEILEIVSENFVTTSVVTEQQNPSCVELNDFFLNTGVTDKFIVRSDSGTVLQSGKSGNDLFVERIENTFFRVYGSEEFDIGGGSIGGCQPLDKDSGYTIGLSREEILVFESKVTELLNNYTLNYTRLKTTMGLGSNDEFGFAFTYSSGTKVKTPEANISINVYAEHVPVQYIKTDGAREQGFIDVIIW